LVQLTNGTIQAFDAANQLCWSAPTSGTSCATAPTGATTYSYDSHGNRTTVTPPAGAATTLAYDQANRLTAYGATATYAYNGDGLRLSKTVSGTTSSFVWDLAEGLPLPLVDGTTNYVYGPGGLPLEQVSSGTALYYYHHDQLGSTRVLTNSAGAPVATATYDSYGKLLASTGSAANPFGYAGQYADAESGFLYLRARYYDPVTGVFLSRDPLAGITRSPYSYVADNPLNGTDPAGLCPWGMGEVCHVVKKLEQFGADHSQGVCGAFNGGLVPALAGGDCPTPQSASNCSDAVGASGPLRFLHGEEGLRDSPGYRYWSQQPTDEIVRSLAPGSGESLLARADGTIMDGNTRSLVL
jgi:RHS repeat-associated protein